MPPFDQSLLKRYARRYIWWEPPDVAAEQPQRVVARVMNIGDFDDVVAIAAVVGDDYLREVLRNAEVGQFNDRSWHYWHYRLGLATKPGDVPAQPTRKLE